MEFVIMLDYIGIALGGRYHIVKLLGEGGMALVYKAFDSILERYVAIKIIRKEAYPSEKWELVSSRFALEAKALAKFKHTNIADIYDYGEYEESPYIVMELITGGTLKQRLYHNYSPEDAAKILIPIAGALDYAHKKGIIHRDVKPSNIMFRHDDVPVITDFGIAKLLSNTDGSGLTQNGMVIGTPEYMSPEQGLSKEVDGRSDEYSLGIILYEMLTGEKPFSGDTPIETIIKHQKDPIPESDKITKNVQIILYKALEKKPENRYPTIGTFGNELKKLIAISSGSYNNQNDTTLTFEVTVPNDQPINNSLEIERDNHIIKKVDRKKFLILPIIICGFLLLGFYFAYTNNAVKFSSILGQIRKNFEKLIVFEPTNSTELSTTKLITDNSASEIFVSATPSIIANIAAPTPTAADDFPIMKGKKSYTVEPLPEFMDDIWVPLGDTKVLIYTDKRSGLQGIADEHGNILMEPICKEILDQRDHGMRQNIVSAPPVLVCSTVDDISQAHNDQFGTINLNDFSINWGQFFPGTDYVHVIEYQDGMAIIEKDIFTDNSKYGYLDSEGNISIGFLYDAASKFEDGYAVVRKDDKWKDNKWSIIEKDGYNVFSYGSWKSISRIHNRTFIGKSKADIWYRFELPESNKIPKIFISKENVQVVRVEHGDQMVVIENTSGGKIIENCPMKSYLKKGDTAEVVINVGLKIRKEPAGEETGLQAFSGKDIYIVSGPICEKDVVWFEINFLGHQGWCMEGKDGTYYLRKK